MKYKFTKETIKKAKENYFKNKGNEFVLETKLLKIKAIQFEGSPFSWNIEDLEEIEDVTLAKCVLDRYRIR